MKVAGRKRCFEEATPTAPRPAEPHGPRRCGGPEHSVGFSLGAGDRDPRWPHPIDRAAKLTERGCPNQHINLLIDSKFPYQPKALWLTQLRLQPLRWSDRLICAPKWWWWSSGSGRVGDHAVAAIALGAI